LLETGCGPGTATLPFAGRGCSMRCIELGASLAGLARARLAEFPRIEIVHADFEEVSLPEGAFDLALSGSAFHWLNPGTALPRIAGALRTPGALAVFWNHQWRPETPMGRALQAVYRTVPTLSRHDHFDVPGQPARYQTRLAKRRAGIEASGLFDPVETREYPWTESYDADAYLKLMQTYSDRATLAPDQRARLLDAVREAIEANGGTVERQYVSSLLFTRCR